MNCKKCNAVIAEGSTFCQYCGAPVEGNTEPLPNQPVAPVQPQQPIQQPMDYNNPQAVAGQGYAPNMMPPVQPPKKKKSKAWIAIPIVLVLIVIIAIIAALAGGSSKDKLVGTWTASIDYSDYLTSEVSDDAEIAEFIGYGDMSVLEAEIEYTFTFNDDNTCTASMTQESYDDFMDSYIEFLRGAFIAYIRDQVDVDPSLTDEDIFEMTDFASVENDLRNDPELSKETLDDFDTFATYSVSSDTITFYEADTENGYYYEAEYTISDDDTVTISFTEVANENMASLFQNIVLTKTVG